MASLVLAYALGVVCGGLAMLGAMFLRAYRGPGLSAERPHAPFLASPAKARTKRIPKSHSDYDLWKKEEALRGQNRQMD